VRLFSLPLLPEGVRLAVQAVKIKAGN